MSKTKEKAISQTKSIRVQQKKAKGEKRMNLILALINALKKLV